MIMTLLCNSTQLLLFRVILPDLINPVYQLQQAAVWNPESPLHATSKLEIVVHSQTQSYDLPKEKP